MLEYGIKDFRKKAAKRVHREKLAQELAANHEIARKHMLAVGDLSPSYIETADSRENFEMKAILVKELVGARKRILEIYNLFLDKDLTTYMQLLLDLRRAELALIILEIKRVKKQKTGLLEGKKKKQTLEKLSLLDERARADIAKLEKLLSSP